MNSCGSCNWCCKLTAVDALEKPAGEWCKHCVPGEGCLIYDERPVVCSEFKCVWLAGGFTNVALRPDKLKVMFVVTQKDKLVSYMDLSYPDADTSPKARSVIDGLTKQGLKSVSCVVGKGVVDREFTDPGIRNLIKERQNGVRNLLQP